MNNEEIKKELLKTAEKLDFSVLFREEEGGLMKFLPILNLVLEFIILILLWRIKK